MSAVPNTCPMNGKTHETVFAHLASHTTHIKAWYKAEELGKAGGDETEETADAHALCWYTTYMSMGLGYCDQVKAAAEHILCCHGRTVPDLTVLVNQTRYQQRSMAAAS